MSVWLGMRCCGWNVVEREWEGRELGFCVCGKRSKGEKNVRRKIYFLMSLIFLLGEK